MIIIAVALGIAATSALVSGYTRYRDQRKSVERWLNPPERSTKRRLDLDE